MLKQGIIESISPLKNELYTALSLRRNEIRLIALQPGAWTDDVKCRLLVSTFNEAAASGTALTTGPLVHGDEDYLFGLPPHPLLPLPTEYAESNVAGPSSILGAGYEALSYVWGDPRSVCSILVNEKAFPVTHNLFLALKHLRLPYNERKLWVDAICINQEDVEERSQQVQIMQKIYWRARRVIVWLGERVQKPVLIPNLINADYSGIRLAGEENPFETVNRRHGIYHRYLGFRNSSKPFQFGDYTILDDAGGAFDLMRILASFEGHIDEALLEGSSIFWSHEAGVSASQEMPAPRKTIKDILDTVWPSLLEIMNRPWWNRVWIVQECVLPKQVLVACGASTIHWALISQTARYFLHHSTCCLKRDEEKALFEKFRILDRIRYNIQRWSRYPILQGRFDLFLLMGTFRHRSATDGRDKVYSVLSLIDDDESKKYPLPKVDYGLSMAAVYAIATVNIIKTHGDLRVLPGPCETKRQRGLPSWVVDWSVEDQDVDFSILLRYMYDDLYRGSRVQRGNVSLYSDLVLGLRGHKIGTISNIGEVITEHPRKISAVPSEIYSWLLLGFCSLGLGFKAGVSETVDTRILLEMDRAPYSDNEDYMSAFCRTLIADIGHSLWSDCQRGFHSLGKPWDLRYRRSTREDVQCLRQWLFRSDRGNLREWHLKHLISRILLYHRLIVTQSGYIGMAPARTQTGDVLYILEGGGTPIVLRPCPRPRPCWEDTYEYLTTRHGTLDPARRRTDQTVFKFVGHCYVHGMMDKGESFFENGDYEAVLLR